ncbi:MAG: 50S ribosomal protein L30 [Thermoplasmata archaeon]|nr:50S ribosomal protein L30 [Thermoplasmata archaeon]
MAWMIIRVRGTIHAKEDIRVTLKELHLNRPNHATVVPESADYKGMLSKVQGYVTWGEAEPETLRLLVEQRAESRTGGRVSGAGGDASKSTGDLAELASGILAHGLSRQESLKPLFRLKAPTGGWRSTKKPFSLGGALGYRGRAINTLARRML